MGNNKSEAIDVSKYINKSVNTADNSASQKLVESFFDSMHPGDTVTNSDLAKFLAANGITLPEKQKTDVPNQVAPRTEAVLKGTIIKSKSSDGKAARIIYTRV